MSIPPLPQLKREAFRWHPSPDDPRIVQRLANGTEAWVGIKDENAKGQYDNYPNISLTTVDIPSPSLALLKETFAAALVHIRFLHPEVACTAVWGETGPPYIQYLSPKDNIEALEWARDVIMTRVTPKNGLEVRKELVKARAKRVHRSAKSLEMYLISHVADDDTPLERNKSVELLMHFNHIYWDGISARMFAGDLLKQYGKAWGERDLEYEWGNEIKHLSEPILDACRVEIKALGDEFNKAREEFVTSLLNSDSSWGLPVKNAVGNPCTELYEFTKAETDAMVHAIKTRLGPQYTMSHLGHAATMLALLKARPLPLDAPENTVLIMPFPVNGRRFLHDVYMDNQYGACQASAVVEFENLKSWVVDEDDTDAVRATLARGCKHVKESYDYWLKKEFQLALGVSKDNFLADFLSSTPMSFSGSSIPIFISDGIVDRYIAREVVSATGKLLMNVRSPVFFLDTYHPDILIRMDSWTGLTNLSLCFNDGYYAAVDAEKFFGYIANFMLEFAK